jgi:hypothetical protein
VSKRKLSGRPKLNTRAAKAYLGNPGNALFWGWIAAGEFTPIRLSERKIVFEPDELDAFLERKAGAAYTPNRVSGMRGHDAKMSDSQAAD